ncbi:hypothetical protein Droror1_Dr00005434 [Drosera rotundifolia]
MERSMSASMILLLFLGLACMLSKSASALIHVVGGSDGWEIPPNATFYQEWAKPRTFGVGDKLVFPYRTGAHNVLQVTQKDYEVCGNENVIKHYFRGPTIIQLNTTGDYFFYSAIGTHCEAGQKLHIAVVNGPGSSGMFFGYPDNGTSSMSPAPAPAKSSSASPVPALAAVTFALPIFAWIFM